MTLLIVFFLLSIVFSFLCSVWEAVLLSITPSYTNTKVQEGSAIGLKLQEFKEDIDKPLSAILTLNTIAHTVGAIGVGAQAANVFESVTPISIAGIELSWESIVAALMTLAILVLSEIIPKTIGANNWKSLAPFTVRSLSFLLIILKPFIWLSQLITKRFKSEHGKSVLSRADFLAMANVGETSGTLQTTESAMIKNLLTLEKVKVFDIMTPRIVMNLANEDNTLQNYYDQHPTLRYSRIPLFAGETADTITGIILKDELLNEIIKGNASKKLKDIKRDVNVVQESDSLKQLFDKGDDTPHMSIVVDEYGSVTGLVTMEDVLETILGFEIVDETDDVADLREHARKKWQKKAQDMGIDLDS